MLPLLEWLSPNNCKIIPAKYYYKSAKWTATNGERRLIRRNFNNSSIHIYDWRLTPFLNNFRKTSRVNIKIGVYFAINYCLNATSKEHFSSHISQEYRELTLMHSMLSSTNLWLNYSLLQASNGYLTTIYRFFANYLPPRPCYSLRNPCLNYHKSLLICCKYMLECCKILRDYGLRWILWGLK
jgi:hypothetical protein